MTEASRKTGSGGPGSAAITNDDEYTLTEADDGVDDFNDKRFKDTKDPRSY